MPLEHSSITPHLFVLCACRNFRTFTAPSAVQFISLAVENSGEVVAAGSQDDFQVRTADAHDHSDHNT
jgi:ATP-dependent Clp protease adapter protein ClpS